MINPNLYQKRPHEYGNREKKLPDVKKSELCNSKMTTNNNNNKTKHSSGQFIFNGHTLQNEKIQHYIIWKTKEINIPLGIEF